MATWDDVRAFALALPGVEEGTSYGTAAWKVGGRLMVWDRPLREADRAALGDAAPDGPVLGVAVEHLGAKAALLQGEEACFTTPHFDGHPTVLLDLERVAPELLRELVTEAWLARAPSRLAREGPYPER